MPKGVSFCSLIGQQVLRLPEQSRALFGEARYSSSAAFTSSPFKRRSKTFDDPKAFCVTDPIAKDVLRSIVGASELARTCEH